MNQLYRILLIKKQSFHQMLKRRDRDRDAAEQILLMVNKIRKDHPCMSVREIYFKLKPPGMGRDKFERFCFERGYRVIRPKNYRLTTDSRGVIRFPNLIKEVEVTDVNQVLVSDITYYEMLQRYYYLTLIMDLYNREVIGFSASASLRTEDTTLPALKCALRNRGKDALEGAIIHSDGGGQYYSQEFRNLTGKLKMRNSMTEAGVYENAHAERLNGIIKNNYLYPYGPKTFPKLQKELARAVYMYNHGKPHQALNRMDPVQYRLLRSKNHQEVIARAQSRLEMSAEKNHNTKTQINQRTHSKTVNVI